MQNNRIDCFKNLKKHICIQYIFWKSSTSWLRKHIIIVCKWDKSNAWMSELTLILKAFKDAAFLRSSSIKIACSTAVHLWVLFRLHASQIFNTKLLNWGTSWLSIIVKLKRNLKDKRATTCLRNFISARWFKTFSLRTEWRSLSTNFVAKTIYLTEYTYHT